MRKSNIIFIGGAITMVAVAGYMVYLTKKCKQSTNEVLSLLGRIQYTLKKCNEEITSGNQEIHDASKLLRKLVRIEAEKNVASTVRSSNRGQI